MDPKRNEKPITAVIIPAYNEEERIGSVIEAVAKAMYVDEIIVVSDGSVDRTVAIAQAYEKTCDRLRVLGLPFNMGKGGAMCAGVAVTRAEIIAFVDADLRGLRAEHLEQILKPVINGRYDMCIGVFRGGQFWSDTAQRISPYISGQRAMRRSLFDSIPYLTEIRYGVEVTINLFAKRQNARIHRVVLRGVSNTFKERKLGLVKGTTARAKMYAEIGRAMVRTRRRTRKKNDRRTWL